MYMYSALNITNNYIYTFKKSDSFMNLSCIFMGIFHFYDYENTSFRHLIYTMLLELIQL